MSTWEELEQQIRDIASNHWNAACHPREINHVKCDGIIEWRPDYWIAIEITKESRLSKLRNDLSKFATIRPYLLSQHIYVECHFVTEKKTSSLKQSGKGHNVEVRSIAEFSEFLIGREAYHYQRTKIPFGSAVDPDTGEMDTGPYARVSYQSNRNNEQVSILDIEEKIKSKENIVLLGEFGTGKSRCVYELYKLLSNSDNNFPVIAINLRECWGLNSFDLIIRSHLQSLGLTHLSDNIIKLAIGRQLKFLLDGFDELGSQSWTGEAERLKELRRKSLTGINDLVTKCSGGGLLIAGREHYFSSNEELLSCLGLQSDTEFLKCPEEFSDDEIRIYLNLKDSDNLPAWMPKKPLICQLFRRLDPDEAATVTENVSDEVDFFDRFLSSICKRESRIHPSIDEQILRGVLLYLADLTRDKDSKNEELSPQEINQAFYAVSGLTPLDESAIMLQRLPYLGRTEAGNSNRVFIDDYAKVD